MQENETQNQIPVDEQQPSSSKPKEERTIADIDKEIEANKSKRHGSAKKRYLGLNYVGHAIKDIGRHSKRKSLEKEKEGMIKEALAKLQKAISCIDSNDLFKKLKKYVADSGNPYKASENQGKTGYLMYTNGKLIEPQRLCMTQLSNVIGDVTSRYSTVRKIIETNADQMTLSQKLDYIRNKTQNATNVESNFKSYCDEVYSKFKNQVMTFKDWCEHKKKKLIGIFKTVKTSAKSVKEGEQAVRAFIKVVTQCLNNKTADQKDIDLALKCVNTMLDPQITHAAGPSRFWRGIRSLTQFDFCPYNVSNNDQKKIYGLAVLYTVDNGNNDNLLKNALNAVKESDKLL